MNLSSNDMGAVGVTAFFSAVVGGLFSLLTLYSDRRSGALLTVHTDALHNDRQVLSFCRELERRVKHIDAAAVYYLQIIDSVDRIVKIRLELQKDKSKATKEDEEETFNQLSRLHIAMRNLIEVCKKILSTKEIFDLENLCTKLSQIGVDDHIKAITLLTKYTKPR